MQQGHNTMNVHKLAKSPIFRFPPMGTFLRFRDISDCVWIVGERNGPKKEIGASREEMKMGGELNSFYH